MDMFKKGLKKAQAKATEVVFVQEQPAPAAAPATTPAAPPAAPATEQTRDISAAPAPAAPADPTAAPATTPAEPAAAPAAPADPAAIGVPTTAAPTAIPAPGTVAPPQAAPVDDEGVIIETMGNGTTIRKHADGHKSTTHPDGTIKHDYLDGSTKTIYPNGQVSFYTPTHPKEDYLDKAVGKGAKALGLNLSRGTTEKVSDKGRGMFEKFTGKKVSSKISN